MRRLSLPVLLALAAVVGVASWAVTHVLVDRGSTLPAVPVTVPAALIAVAGALVWLGSRVRQYKAGNRPGLDPIEAARTAVFAQAAAYSGGALLGAYVGAAVAAGAAWDQQSARDLAVSALVAAGAALGLAVAGAVVERWCLTGGGDDDAPGASGPVTPDAA